MPDWMRRRMTDAQRFGGLCVLAGLLCGLTAVLFHLAIHHLFVFVWHAAEGRDPVAFAAILIAAPTFAGLVVGLAVRFFSPEAAGSGIPQKIGRAHV